MSARRCRALALLLGLVLCGASCGDPTAPGALPGAYRLTYVWGWPTGPTTRELPTEFRIVGSTAMLRIAGGTLLLRADSTYEVRLTASRDSAGTRTPLPVVVTGQYSAAATPRDIAFDYALALTIDGRPGETWSANRDNFNGQIVASSLEVGQVWLGFFFRR